MGYKLAISDNGNVKLIDTCNSDHLRFVYINKVGLCNIVILFL